MDEELISIGKMAELNRVSVPTLRLYDEKGLLKPRYTDPQTGYRYYSIDQNARLDMIVYMKELGMSLAQIAQALEKEDISLIEELLSRKNEQIHQQIRQLKAQHDAVERAILSIERYRKSPATGTFSLEYIDRRYAWGAPCTANFYADGIRSYETQLGNDVSINASQGLVMNKGSININNNTLITNDGTLLLRSYCLIIVLKSLIKNQVDQLLP